MEQTRLTRKQFPFPLLLEITHVSWNDITEKERFHFFRISICFLWFIEQLLLKLGTNLKGNEHFDCKFFQHIHECQNYYKPSCRKKMSPISPNFLWFKFHDNVTSVTSLFLRRQEKHVALSFNCRHQYQRSVFWLSSSPPSQTAPFPIFTPITAFTYLH